MSVNAKPPSELGEAAVALVRQRTGLIFSEARRPAFHSALASSMRRAGLRDPGTYLARLGDESALLDDLVTEITVGETYFFREPRQFDAIRHQIIPSLLSRQARERPLRVWSAGCATGEEPYTLAIVLRELGLAGAAHIVATDLSRAALTKARQARYTKWSLRGVSDEVVRTYFEHAHDRFLLAPSIRDAVDFRYLNLAEDSYPSPSAGVWGMDLILCRNVLIYFGADTVARVARRLLDSLSDDGWLLLGASDPPLGDLVPCDVVATGAGLAYRRPGRGDTRPGTTVAVTPIFVRPEQPPPVPPPAGSGPTGVVIPEAPADDLNGIVGADAERNDDGATNLAARLVQHDEPDPIPWILRVRSLANRGDLDAAGRACTTALDHHRTSAELTYLHAALLAEAGHDSEAAAAARRALYLDRGFVVAHFALGRALARLGDTAGARRAFHNAERLLAAGNPTELVPASDGEPAGRLVEMARAQLRLLDEVAT